MVELGQFSLLLALFLSAYAIPADLVGSWRNDSGLIKSGRNATLAVLLCLSVAMAVLWVLLLSCDFRVKYVADHISIALPMAYKISALWAGAAGSLLLWLWLQLGFLGFVFCKGQPGKTSFAAHARAIANLVSVFFLIILVKDKNPFVMSMMTPQDGAGLNPLLQHPAMVLHPPILFVGYAAFAVPFAWAFASLKWDMADGTTPIFKQARNWTMVAWVFLTAGIVLGAWWAYEELGWGGYWAWDPVENSSLMPWLTGTALVHCCRAYSPKSKSGGWLVAIGILTFSLCVFGTFLTRSGLVSSVHAFPDPGMSILYIVLLILVIVLALVLAFMRFRRNTPSDGHQPATAHKFMVYNNYLMVFLTFVIFIGTLFPFLSSLFTENKITLNPEYFNKITSPGGLVLLLFIAVCPHLWRYGITRSWRIIGLTVTLAIALTAWFFTKVMAIPFLVICVFILVNLCADFVAYEKSISKRKKDGQSPKRSLRWYGARIVHLGVALMFIGIAGSGGYSLEEQFAMTPGQQKTIGNYNVIYNEMTVEQGANFTAMNANMSVYKDEQLIAELKPAKAVYRPSGKAVSEVDIRRTLGGDLYLALTQVDTNTEMINMRVLIKPLINWIWIGSIIMVIGAALVMTAFYRTSKQSQKD